MADSTFDRQLYGTADLAVRFGYSKSSIKLLDMLGILPAAKRVGGRRVWDSGDLPLIESAINTRRTRRRQIESGKAA